MAGFDATKMAAMDPTAMAGFQKDQVAALLLPQWPVSTPLDGSYGPNRDGRF